MRKYIIHIDMLENICMHLVKNSDKNVADFSVKEPFTPTLTKNE